MNLWLVGSNNTITQCILCLIKLDWIFNSIHQFLRPVDLRMRSIHPNAPWKSYFYQSIESLTFVIVAKCNGLMGTSIRLPILKFLVFNALYGAQRIFFVPYWILTCSLRTKPWYLAPNDASHAFESISFAINSVAAGLQSKLIELQRVNLFDCVPTSLFRCSPQWIIVTVAQWIESLRVLALLKNI